MKTFYSSFVLFIALFFPSPAECPKFANRFTENPGEIGEQVSIDRADQAPHEFTRSACKSAVYMNGSVMDRLDLCTSCNTYYGALLGWPAQCGYTASQVAGPVFNYYEKFVEVDVTADVDPALSPADKLTIKSAEINRIWGLYHARARR